jgi:hypothetical protein
LRATVFRFENLSEHSEDELSFVIPVMNVESYYKTANNNTAMLKFFRKILFSLLFQQLI